jgi:tRNA threonylcarbamoyl adenosine modification protein (Sua5/YciO/YrdC/YwlC family)
MKYIKIEDYEDIKYNELSNIVKILDDGGIFIFPTDSVYSLGCKMSNKKGIAKILKLTGKPEKKSNLSLFFSDMKSLSAFTLNYNNTIFRTVKSLIPGPYTFIFKASKQVTKSFENTKKEVGIRIPSQSVLQQVIKSLDEPIISTSLNSGDMRTYSNDPYELSHLYENEVDLIIDNGPSDEGVTTVLDCTGDEIELIREGKGEI